MRIEVETVSVYLINLILVFFIIKRVIVIDNDKAHLIFLFYYPALLLLNFLIGFVLKLLKKKLYKNFWQLCTWMMCLFVPIYIVLIMI
jgi:hypothetical protein